MHEQKTLMRKTWNSIFPNGTACEIQRYKQICLSAYTSQNIPKTPTNLLIVRLMGTNQKNIKVFINTRTSVHACVWVIIEYNHTIIMTMTCLLQTVMRDICRSDMFGIMTAHKTRYVLVNCVPKLYTTCRMCCCCITYRE